MRYDEIILNYIRRYGPVSKALIARQTGITPPTVTNICNSLLEKNLIYEEGQEKLSLGRPSLLLQFNETVEHILIVHVRTHRIVFSVVAPNQTVIEERVVSCWECSGDTILENMYQGIEDMLAMYRETIRSIGLILRGPVDSKQGISIYSPHAKWENVPFRYILEEKFGLPVYLENDMRALGTGEYYYGLGKDCQNLVVLKFSFGVGMALVYKGILYRGFADSAGELGHSIFCVDGNQSKTLEEVASETAIRNYIQEEMLKGRQTSLAGNALVFGDSFSGEPIYEAALVGDELAIEAVQIASRYLGMAIANITNTINPERIIISSSLSKAVDIVAPIIQEAVDTHTYRSNPVELVYSTEGSHYTLIGMVDMISAQRAKEIWLA